MRSKDKRNNYKILYCLLTIINNQGPDLHAFIRFIGPDDDDIN